MTNFCQWGKLEIKKVIDLNSVLFDQSQPEGQVIYEVCRGENVEGSFRYDLTLFHPVLLGLELGKTFGHYHENNNPEIYEVLSGRALFLIQKYEDNPSVISEAYLVEAREKDKVVIPFGFGMVTINAQIDKEALIGNWVDVGVKNTYEFFEKLRGGCYYILTAENRSWKAEENKNYQQVPELINLEPKTLPIELRNLEFLSNSRKYKDILTIDNLYERL